MELLSHIKILLRDHERAFIPGFGGFVKEYVPASIDRSKDLFRPPTCTLSFNSQLSKEDGLLAERVMEEEGVGFEQAKEKIRGLAQRWDRELSHNKRLELDGIGILYQDEKGATRFEPDPDPELEPSAYGLPVFYATAIEKAEDSKEAPPEKELEALPGNRVERKKMLLKVAAVLIPLFLILGVGAVQLNSDRLNADLVNWLGGGPKDEAAYKSREELDQKTLSFPSIQEKKKKEPPFRFRLDEKGPVYTVLPEKAMKDDEATSSKNARFFVVGGCFEVKANAEERARELSGKGFPARILDRKRKGLHVVAIDAFADRNKALDGLQKARKAMKGAWLLHRP